MDFESMTDKEISLEVFYKNYSWDKELSKKVYELLAEEPDYCNNAEYAFEIINEIKSKLFEPVYDSNDCFVRTNWEATQNAYLCNMFRAAMIVYLKS